VKYNTIHTHARHTCGALVPYVAAPSRARPCTGPLSWGARAGGGGLARAPETRWKDACPCVPPPSVPRMTRNAHAASNTAACCAWSAPPRDTPASGALPATRVPWNNVVRPRRSVPMGTALRPRLSDATMRHRDSPEGGDGSHGVVTRHGSSSDYDKSGSSTAGPCPATR